MNKATPVFPKTLKFSLTILCYFILNLLHSQDLKTIDLLPPESQETTDFSFLSKELYGKQVVMLGEHTHMHGNIFEMKARVVEYLHQKLGFTTFAMESPMYEIWKMNQKGFTKEGFNNAVFSVWSETSEFQRLVNYLDQNNIKVIGFDSQVNEAEKFIDDFFDYCEKNKIDVKLVQDDMGIIMEAVLNAQGFDENDITFQTFEQELNRIIHHIEKLADTEDNYYWKQFTKSLLACSQDAFYTKEQIYSTVVGDKDYNIRDKQMADNLLSYIKRHPDEKIICWADNIHLINDNSSVTNPIAKDFIPMGSYIKKALKNEVYSLATIHANDSLLNTNTYKWAPTPIQVNSFEYDLKKLNKPYLFVSSNQEVMKTLKYTRLLDFIAFSEVRVDQLHDGYIFFQQGTRPKLEKEREALSKNHNQADKQSAQIETGKSTVVKGQILDKETNEPIPLATLVIRKENMYRIADENGNFELPVKNATQAGMLVEISSVGYGTKSFALNKGQEKLYLESQFESLSEVVIKRALTPKDVLKKAIKGVKTNHPASPFNFSRYSSIIKNRNDHKEIDLELITRDYNQGYTSPFITTQRVEQVKWNENASTIKYKTSSGFFAYRENPIQYSTILHKRKYKKFKLNFVLSNKEEGENAYIIAFETERNKWSYTNKPYPTKYSGRVYIDKENFALLKVVENWETAFNSDEIKKYFKGQENIKDISQFTVKEENSVQFSQFNGERYYATNYFRRSILEKLTDKGAVENSVTEISSHAFDFETAAVNEIEYEYRTSKNTRLDRVEYDASFWTSFYESDFFRGLE